MRKDLFVDPSFGLMTAVEHVNLKLVTGIYSAQFISKFPRVSTVQVRRLAVDASGYRFDL